jgi:hypothetical protein
MFGTIAAVFALLGTGLQGYVSLKQLKELDPEGHRAFVAVDDLKTEFTFTRHPVRWFQRRGEMRAMMKDSPREALLYRRVQWQIVAWALLAVASAFAVITVIWG